MKRREAVHSLGLLTTHALFPGILTGFIASCGENPPKEIPFSSAFFSEEEWAILPQIIDTIIPATKTLSASETGTQYFLDEVFDKCMVEGQKEALHDGLGAFIPQFQSSENKEEFLTEIDQKAFTGDASLAWWVTLKQHTMIGFFTSQEGTTKASNYVKVPGDYEGEIILDKETLNYGKTNLHYYI